MRLITSGAKSTRAVAQEFGIREDLLRKWRHSVQHGQPQVSPGQRTTRESSLRDAFPGHGHLTSQDEENRQLRRQIAVLTEEREILKKATAFFARQSR